MSAENRPPGKTTIAAEVLATIAQMAALSVDGVSSMAPAGGLFQQRGDGGTIIHIRENIVDADIFIIVKEQVNIREVGRSVQQQVARAIQKMTGMDVGRIDIHVEDIHYEGGKA